MQVSITWLVSNNHTITFIKVDIHFLGITWDADDHFIKKQRDDVLPNCHVKLITQMRGSLGSS